MADQTKKCPFCAEDILADAKKCKHCQSVLGDKPVVIEKTSKKIKQQMLNGIYLVIGGILFGVMFGASENKAVATIGGFMVLAGVVMFFNAKWKKWWHHG